MNTGFACIHKNFLKAIKVLLVVLFAVLGVIGVRHYAYAAELTQITHDQVEEFQLRVSSEGFSIGAKTDILTPEQTINATCTLDLKREHYPQKAMSFIEYDLPPYFTGASSGPIPVYYNSTSLSNVKAGMYIIQNGKFRIIFTEDTQARFFKFDLPFKFSPELTKLAQDKGAHKLHVPFAFPGAQVITGGVYYPSKQSAYPLDLTFSEPSVNDEEPSNPDVFNVNFAPSANPYNAYSTWMITDMSGQRIQYTNPLQSGESFIAQVKVGRDNAYLFPGTKLTYDLPPNIVYVGSNPIAIRDASNNVVGSAVVEDQKLIITRSDWSRAATLDPMTFKVSSELTNQINNTSAEVLSIPLGFPNAQVNGVPNNWFPPDFKAPTDVKDNDVLQGDDLYYLPLVKKGTIPKYQINFYGSIYTPGRRTELASSEPVFQSDVLDFDIHLTARYGWGTQTKGSRVTYRLPPHIVSAQPTPVNLIDLKTKEVVGTCTAKGDAITFTFSRAPRKDAEIGLSDRLKLTPSSDLNQYFNQPFVKRVTLPFAIPFTNIGKYPFTPNSQNPKLNTLYQQPADLVLPPVTFNETPLDNPKGDMGVFELIVMKDNPGNDDDPLHHEIVSGDTQGEEPTDPNALSGSDLDMDFKLSFKGTPLSQEPYYTENDELELKGVFQSKPGVSYLGKRIEYTIPSKYVKLSAGLDNVKIIDPVTKIEIGTATIDTKRNKIILNFTTDGSFKGSLSTKLSFNVFAAINPAQVGEALNVPFTIPNAKLDGKPQPAPPIKLPEPTIGSEKLVLPDKNMAVLTPHRVIHEIPNYYDGKKTVSYTSDSNNQWLSGIAPIYAPDADENTFVIAYDLPWKGIQFNSDLNIYMNQYDGGIKISYLGTLDNDGIYRAPNKSKTILMFKRVWFHTDKSGQPIVEKKRVPILGSDGHFIPGKYTSQEVVVPKDAVERPILDTTPPPGFDEKSPCGFVIRLVNYPYSGLGLKYATKIVDLGAAQGMTAKKQLIFKNSWYYGQEVWKKDNPNLTRFFGPQKPEYVADMIRANANVAGELEFDGKYSIRKISQDTGKPLAGARFALLRADGSPSFDAEGRVLNHLVTNEDGYVCYEDQKGTLTPLSELSLLIGTNFVLEETEAPFGYELPDNPKTSIPSITKDMPHKPLIIKNRRSTPPTSLTIKDAPAKLILAGIASVSGIMMGAYAYKRRHAKS